MKRAHQTRLVSGAVILLTVFLVGARGCGDTVTLFGEADTFGGLTGSTTTPSGDSLMIKAMPYGFSAGQAAWFPAVTSDGTIFVPALTQKGNQLIQTGCTMEIVCFHPGLKLCRDPDTGEAAHVALFRVPTALGAEYVPDAACQTTAGGADISDIAVIGSGSNEHVVFVSLLGAIGGSWPMWGAVRKTDGLWSLDPTSLRTPLDFHESNPPVSTQACTLRPKSCCDDSGCGSGTCPGGDCNTWTFSTCDHTCTTDAECSDLGVEFVCREGQCVAGSCGLANEIDELPISGRVVLADYAGSIWVTDGDDTVLAHYAVPTIENPCAPGTNLGINPRQVEIDPTSTLNDERFVVSYDSNDPRGNPSQIFRYIEATKTIEPLTATFFGTIAWGQQPACGQRVVQNSRFDNAGNLWVRRGEPLPSSSLVYLREGASTSAEVRCASGSWGMTCPADVGLGHWNGNQTDPSFRYGFSLGAAFDPVQTTMLVATANGLIVPQPRIDGAGRSYFATLPPVDLGMHLLPKEPGIGHLLTKVALDVSRGNLWLPVRARQTCDPFAGDPCDIGLAAKAWIYRARVDALLHARTRIVAVASGVTVPTSGDLLLDVEIATTAKEEADGPMPNRIFVYRDNDPTPIYADMQRTANQTGYVFSASVPLDDWGAADRIHWYAVLKDVAKGNGSTTPAVVAGVESP